MPRSRNIAFLGPAYPYRGGIAHFIERMAVGMADREHRVSVFTFTRQYPSLLFPGRTQMATDDSAAGEIKAIRVLDTINPVSWWKTAKRIADSGSEALIIKYWTPFLAPAFGSVVRLLRRKGIPTIVVIDNAIPHEKKPGDHVLSRFLLSACKAALVMSESVEKDLETLNVRIPVKQVYHPVFDNFGAPLPKSTARSRLDISEDAPVVLFFGFIRRYKGLDTLLDAWPRILKSIPETVLVIAGEFYQDEKEIRSKLADTSEYRNVKLLDEYIPVDKVSELFGAADVVVQPYRSATQSGVAQIAYHFERPVITTNVGGLAEVVPHGISGLVVEPEDPEALADGVVSFFKESMLESLTNGVREEKKRYGWDHIFEALEESIE